MSHWVAIAHIDMFRKLIPLILVLAFSATAWAVSETPQVAVRDPSVPVEMLRHQLIPMTKGELEKEAAAWLDLVKFQATRIAEAQVAGAAGSAIDPLKEEEKRLLDRFDAVLAAWEAKGGDAKEFRAYAAAVRGAELRVDNPTGLAAALRRWFTSEDGAVWWSKRFAIFLLIVFASAIIASIAGRLVAGAMDRYKASSKLLDQFVVTVVKRGALVLGAIIGLSTLGVNVGALLALIGGGAFILGFALQESLSNFASGIMLMIYRPFDVGDGVIIGGVEGTVDAVTLVNTTLRSWDNKVILVPNKNVWGQTITNITGADKRRVDLTFGIAHENDVGMARSLLERIVGEHSLVLAEPAPTVRIHQLADLSVVLICRPWTRTADYWTVYWDITQRAKEEFDAHGIAFPTPPHDPRVRPKP